jgi:hypothetical protein
MEEKNVNDIQNVILNDIYDSETKRLMIAERQGRIRSIESRIKIHGAEIERLRKIVKQLKAEIANIASLGMEE